MEGNVIINIEFELLAVWSETIIFGKSRDQPIVVTCDFSSRA